jgi:hypothetical protein
MNHDAEHLPGHQQIGLRIGDGHSPKTDSEPTGLLEVQEITGSVVRLSPETPSAPKVPREVTFLKKEDVTPKDTRPGESSDWGVAPKHSSLRWLLGTGLAVVLLVIGAMTLLPHINKSNAHPSHGQRRLKVESGMTKSAEALNDMLTRQPEAEQVFHRFATATIIDDFLPLVRDSDALASLIRSHPHSPKVKKSWLPSGNCRWNVFEMGDRVYGILEGSLPDFSTFTAYMTVSNKRLHLDWKATTGFGSATFDELSKGQGDASEIRAWIQPSQFYTVAFPESDYLCFILDSPRRDSSIWCYVRRKSTAADTVAGIFQSGGILPASSGFQKVTLRLSREQTGALPNQWTVEELLHKDWITP